MHPETTPQHNLPHVDTSRAATDPTAVYLAGLSRSSRRTMRGALDTLAQILLADDTAVAQDVPWGALRFQHAQALRSELADRYAHTTANRLLSALRGVLQAAWKLGQMTAEDYHKTASVESVRGTTLPAGRALSAEELHQLTAVCEQTPLGIRDATIIALLYGCGLRREELVALDLDDYRKSEQELRIRGKGNKERSVPVGHVQAALTHWLAIRGQEDGPLFWGLGNRNRGGRLTDQAIYNMLRKRAKQAGVAHMSPHDLRRTFISDLLDAGADIVTVQKMAGHADPGTTSRYDRRDKRVQHEAAALLRVPTSR